MMPCDKGSVAQSEDRRGSSPARDTDVARASLQRPRAARMGRTMSWLSIPSRAWRFNLPCCCTPSEHHANLSVHNSHSSYCYLHLRQTSPAANPPPHPLSWTPHHVPLTSCLRLPEARACGNNACGDPLSTHTCMVPKCRALCTGPTLDLWRWTAKK